MRNKTSWLITGICAGLVAIVWFVFGQATRFPFINFDDPEYVYEVPEINSGLSLQNLKWAFTHWPATNWFPLKNISHMFEFQFYGSNPGLFHLTNVVLHAATAVLLFLVLRRMTGAVWRSAFVAAVFAIPTLVTLELMKLMLDCSHITRNKIDEMYAYWEYWKDLPHNAEADLKRLFDESA